MLPVQECCWPVLLERWRLSGRLQLLLVLQQQG